MTKKRPTAISFFSGAGGMDAGFGSAGFDVRLAIEIDASCCETLENNLLDTRVLNKDLNHVTVEEICELSGLNVGEIDCIFGGPPCQSFSLAGKREGLNDDRGQLVFKFVDFVRRLRPKTFVMENVKGMVNWQGGVVLDEIEAMFEAPLSTGEVYKVSHQVLNAADFGVPQSRQRVFVVGTMLAQAFEYPKPTHAAVPDESNQSNCKPHVTVGEALSGLPKADPPSKTAMRVSQTIKGRIEKHGY